MELRYDPVSFLAVCQPLQLPTSIEIVRAVQLAERVKYDKLVNIELVGEEDVFDLTTTPEHTFVGNGFALHNCVRVVHSEVNAIAQAAKNGVKVDGATLYVTASPCWQCFRAAVAAGVKAFFFSEFYRDERIFDVARELGIPVHCLTAQPALEPRGDHPGQDHTA